MALGNNPTPNEVVKETKRLNSDKQDKIVQLTEAQYETLVNDGQVTVDGVTYIYDANAFYAITGSSGGSGVTDIKINNTSIVSNGVANIVTNTAYNATSNKIATMSDVPTTTDTVTSDSTSALTSGGAYTALSNKVDKTNYQYQVYTTDSAGNQNTTIYGITATAGYIVQRAASGQIQVPTTPTETYHATSKTYVDAGLSGKLGISSNAVGLQYTTTAPTATNADGLKIVVLSSEPATKYSGWLYIITD